MLCFERAMRDKRGKRTVLSFVGGMQHTMNFKRGIRFEDFIGMKILSCNKNRNVYKHFIAVCGLFRW